MTNSVVSPPAYVLDHVSKVFGGEVPFTALNDVQLTIPMGAFCTVVGPSGSGKSTLLSILGLLDQPSGGELFVDGNSVNGASEYEISSMRANLLAFVFQAFHLMQHRTVLDNVMLGGLYRGLTRRERECQALECLQQVGLESKAANQAGTLSGGERQRAAIARGLVGAPRILLCDEPTGNLDTKNGDGIVHLLQDLSRTGITIVIVTHDGAIARLGDHQIQVVDGHVSGDGSV